MGTVVLDSSTVLALLDPGDAHHAAARAVYPVQGSRYLTSTSVLAEVLVGASRLGRQAVLDAEARLDALVDDVVVIDRAVAHAAALIRAKHRSIRLPDAFVLATVVVHEAETVLSADQRMAAVDPRVQLVG